MNLNLESSVILLVASIVWLQLSGSIFACYIAKHPFSEKWVFLSVGIGVLYTTIGGMGLHYSVTQIFFSLLNFPPIPWNIRVLFLITPWFAFVLSGPPMAVGQYVKHIIAELFLKSNK